MTLYFSIVSDVQTDGDTISFNFNLPDDMDTAANSLTDDESSTATITTEGGRGSTHKSENTGRRGGPSDAASRDPPSSKEKPRKRKRRTELPKPDYKEYDEPSEDSFIFCHLCNDLKIGPCQEEGHCPKIGRLQDWPCKVRVSSIPNAGQGVFNNGRTIEVGDMFGPYEGDKVPLKEYDRMRKVAGGKESGNAWKIRGENGKFVSFIDPGFHPDPELNMIAKVNNADTFIWFNVMGFQYHGEIYYRVLKPVK